MRRRFNLSQAALAELLKVSPAAVAHWERGLKNMRPSHADLLERVVADLEAEARTVKV